MKYISATLVFLSILAFSSECYSQFGVRAKYNSNTFASFDDYLESNIQGSPDKIFSSTIGVGVDYWFRLKKYRIEFLPEVHLGLKSTTDYPSIGASADLSYLGFNFNTQLYIFDLEGDCDCPTFSKQGPSLNKGIFLNISPGFIYNTKELSTETSDPPFQSDNINFKLGIGIGYDIGINDLFTITPMVSYNYTPGVAFDELENIRPNSTAEEISSSLNQLEFQVRLGFRPDYVKSYGRRR